MLDRILNNRTTERYKEKCTNKMVQIKWNKSNSIQAEQTDAEQYNIDAVHSLLLLCWKMQKEESVSLHEPTNQRFNEQNWYECK